MNITYTWNVLELKAYPEKDGFIDVVFQVSWYLIGNDDQDRTATINNTTNIKLNESGNYIPYADLTQEQIISWVKNAYGVKKVAEFEANLSQQIEAQANPPVITQPLPWA